jgi:ABC-type glycerol-3-phosphate transport system permease component
MKRTPLHQTLIYALLILGAAVFTFPFLWMVSTSMKVDREMYTEDLKVLPMTPRPVRASPYIDPTFFLSLPDTVKKQNAVVPELERLARASGYVPPESVDADEAFRQIARGLYKRLKEQLSVAVWNGRTVDDATNPNGYSENFDAAVRGILAEAPTRVTPQAVRETADQVYRFLAVGNVRVRGKGVQIHTLASDVPISQQWTLRSQATTSITDFNDGGKPAGKLRYDFASGNSFSLVGEFDLPIDVAELRRVQIDLKPDDTWHDYSLVLEHSGRRFVSRRSGSFGNFDWFTASWQPASDDDHSTRLRTWIVLDDKDASDFAAPNRIRLTLTVDRVTQPAAWANKVKANYIRTNEQIPFWRYVRVSLFLVLANIVLTVFSSSLVAYAFSRITWPGRDLCFLLMLATMMIPTQVTMIPHFLIWTNLGAYDTLSPLWVGAVFGSAFFVFMLRQFMMGIPRDLEDAARIDGCGFLRIYWHVILPLITPSLAAIAVMTFMGTWNDFMSPLIYIADQRLYPLAFGLYAFNIQVNSNPALSMAGSVLMTVPVILMFFFLQRYFIQGITLTGMKG